MKLDETIDNLRTILELPFANSASVFYRDESGELALEPELKYYNETVSLLIQLYHRLPTQQEKDQYLGNFYFSVIEELSIHQTSDINYLLRSNSNYVFMFWVKMGQLDRAIDYFETVSNINGRVVSVLSVVLSLLEIEPEYFNRQSLDRLRIHILKLIKDITIEEEHKRNQGLEFFNTLNMALQKKPIKVKKLAKPRNNYIEASNEELKHASSLANSIIKKIQKTKLEMVKADLEGINQEINQDKEQLKQKISKFSFSEELNQCLDKFDVDYYNADSFDFKSCIAHIRTFIEKLAISIAEKIHAETTIEPSNGIASIGGVRQYFRDSRVDFLSQKQDEFLGSFYAFASDNKIGAHSLTSDREHARIIRNTGIEIGLFLIQLLEKKIADIKQK